MQDQTKSPNKRTSWHASGIARYVFKDGRRTVAPQDALMDCTLPPKEKNDVWEAIEVDRVEGMQTGALLSGLEGLPGAFCRKVGCLWFDYRKLWRDHTWRDGGLTRMRTSVRLRRANFRTGQSWLIFVSSIILITKYYPNIAIIALILPCLLDKR